MDVEKDKAMEQWEYCYVQFEVLDEARPWDISLQAYLCTEDKVVRMISVSPWEKTPLERVFAFLGLRGWELVSSASRESSDEDDDSLLSQRYYFKRPYSEQGKGEEAHWEYGLRLWIVEGGHLSRSPRGEPIK